MIKWIVSLAIVALGAFVLGLWANSHTGFSWQDIAPGDDTPLKARPSFAQDILPILEQDCIFCHGAADAHNGLRLDSFQGVMTGTKFGPVVEPGKPDVSNLMAVLTRQTSPQIWMPYHRGKLSPNKIKNIENWIKIGAPNN